jgi:hypothetical protein
MKKYSKSTGGFYDTAIHGDNIPADAVEITDEQHAALLEGQSSGKCITADAKGFPVLTDPPAPTDDELAAAVRAERDAKLAACDWTMLADVDLTTAELAAWKAYRQALRDVTDQTGFPGDVTWPVSP